MKLLWIGLAGGLGSCARALLSGWAVDAFGTSLPFGTLTVNAIGSFLIGLLMQVFFNTQLISPALCAVLAVGFLGGFTTYSSFNYETLVYIQNGDFVKAALSFFTMSVVCLLAGALGIWVVKGLI